MSDFQFSHFLNAIIYAILGIVIFVGSFIVTDKLTPYHLWREIIEKQNVALAVMVGLMSLGIGIIIAAAVH
jgi:putative membrane protein